MSKTWIPTLFTCGNAFLGFLSVHYSFSGQWGMAGLLIFYCTLLDLFDGRIARILNVSNNFGRDLDSFADFLSFGIAPAFMLTTISSDFFSSNNISLTLLYLVGFIYAFLAASRLAIFNNPTGSFMDRVKRNDPSDFIGMPSTFMGGILGLLMGFDGFSDGFFGQYFPDLIIAPWVFIPLVLLGGICLIIPVPFPKLGRKFFAFKRYPVLNWTIILLLFLFCRWTLLIMSTLYVVIPLCLYFIRLGKVKTNP